MGTTATQPGDRHFTASAYIISKEPEPRILMVYHRKYKNWMPPGGHIERTENPIEAVVREVLEEVGINLGAYIKPDITSDDVVRLRPPDFLLEAGIKAHGDEPEHFHIDFGYVFHVSLVKTQPGQNESQQVEWFTRSQLDSVDTFLNVRETATRLLESQKSNA